MNMETKNMATYMLYQPGMTCWTTTADILAELGGINPRCPVCAGEMFPLGSIGKFTCFHCPDGPDLSMPMVPAEVSFTDKAINFEEFMEQLHKRIIESGNVETKTFFECFLQQQLPVQFKLLADSGWDGMVNAGDFDLLYPMAIEILRDAATASASDANYSVIYDQASEVSRAFCDYLNDFFQCAGDYAFTFIPIVSYTQIAVEAGLVELLDNEMISLTPAGMAAAKSVEQQISASSN